MNKIPRNKSGLGSATSYGIFPFFMAGLNDSINPCSLTIIVLLFFLFFYLCSQRKEIFVFGVVYVSTILITSLYWEWLSLVTASGLDASCLIVRWICLSVAGLVIIFGLLNFYDWGILRITGDKRKMTLKFPMAMSQGSSQTIIAKTEKDDQKEKTFWFWLSLAAIMSGIISAIFISAYPVTPYLLATIYALDLEGQKTAAMMYLFFYHIILLLPIIAAFGIIILTSPWNKMLTSLERFAPTVKIIMAAVSFALGSGLIYFFY